MDTTPFAQDPANEVDDTSSDTEDRTGYESAESWYESTDYYHDESEEDVHDESADDEDFVPRQKSIKTDIERSPIMTRSKTQIQPSTNSTKLPSNKLEAQSDEKPSCSRYPTMPVIPHSVKQKPQSHKKLEAHMPPIQDWSELSELPKEHTPSSAEKRSLLKKALQSPLIPKTSFEKLIISPRKTREAKQKVDEFESKLNFQHKSLQQYQIYKYKKC